MISKRKPLNFSSKFDVVSCFIESNERFLLLKRSTHKPQGGTWAMPAGKVINGESLCDAMTREIKEELGLSIKPQDLQKHQKMYVKYPTYDYVFYVYSLKIDKKFDIKLNKIEHTEYKWVTSNEAFKLNLIQDEDTCIKLFYKLT